MPECNVMSVCDAHRSNFQGRCSGKWGGALFRSFFNIIKNACLWDSSVKRRGISEWQGDGADIRD